MSLYHDHDLLEKLLKIGKQDFVKSAQREDPYASAAKQLAIPLITRLQRTITPEKFDKEDKSSFDAIDATHFEVEAKAEDFRTLGDFLQWAAKNQITWGNQRIAWAANEDHPQDAWVLPVYKSVRSDRDADRKLEKVTAYASKPDLLAYLEHLRDTAAPKNKVLEVMLSKIIGEVNQFLEQKIDERSKKPEHAGVNLDSVVDGFNDIYLDPQNPTAGAEAYPLFTGMGKLLKVRDIVGESSFLSWLGSMKIKGSDVSLTSPEGDRCAAVHILYKRATYLDGVAKFKENVAPGYSKLTEMYVNAVRNFGSKIRGKDGKYCSVISPEGTDKAPASQQDQKGGAWRPSGANVQQTLATMMSNLPLQIRDVDFNRINRFVSMYASIVSDNNREQLNESSKLMQEAMAKATNASIGNKKVFVMSDSPKDLFAQAKDEKEGLALIGYLERVLAQIRDILNMFYTEYGKDLQSGAGAVLQQYNGAGSVFAYNVGNLRHISSFIKSRLNL